MMIRVHRVILFLLLIGCGYGGSTSAAVIPHFSAALPTLPVAASEMAASISADGISVSFTRVLTSRVVAAGEATTCGSFDLSVRWMAPLDLVPAFLAIEASPTAITGLMTVFLGPVCIDLGRTWFRPERWAIVQLCMHPRLTTFLAIDDTTGRFRPTLGWRLFPTTTAHWEVGARFGARPAIWCCWRLR